MNKIFESHSTATIHYSLDQQDKFVKHRGHTYVATGESTGKVTTFENRFAQLIAVIFMVAVGIFTICIPFMIREFRENLGVSIHRIFGKRETNIHYTPYEPKPEWFKNIVSKGGLVDQLKSVLIFDANFNSFTWLLNINSSEGKLQKQFLFNDVKIENIEEHYGKITLALSKILESEVAPTTTSITFNCFIINQSAEGLQGAKVEIKFSENGLEIENEPQIFSDAKFGLSSFSFTHSVITDQNTLTASKFNLDLSKY